MSDPGPVTAAERIGSLDVLRGVAILGILVMNIYAFAMPFPGAYMNPLLMGGADSLNVGTWMVTHIVVDQKFLSIFAMLFGAGIVLMTGKAAQSGKSYGRLFFRRQSWLILFGALHAYFIWVGDILFLYAFVGMVAYLFRNCSLRTLLVIACLLLPVTQLMMLGSTALTNQFGAAVAEISIRQDAGETLTAEEEQRLEMWAAMEKMSRPNADHMRQDVEHHLGSYTEILKNRIPTAIFMQIGMVFMMIWRVTALMLLGMVLMKTGIFTAEKSAGFYRNMMLVAYGLGFPLTIFSAFDLKAHDFDPGYAASVGAIANYYGSIIVGLGHVSLVLLLIKSGVASSLLRRFAAVGRMALTNYLMHSIILTTVFYGYGFGLYGSVSRIEQMGFVVAVIVLQLAYSPWWLERFRFGPAEWLWRSLTYWRRQPMRRLESA